MTKRIALIVLAFSGLFFIGVNLAMSILDIKLPLTGVWKERFEDVEKLNAYAKTQPVELSNAKIGNKSIDGAVINGGLFKSTEWNQVSAKNSNLTKVVFRDGVFDAVTFNNSILTDVIFEDVTLEEVRFVNTTLTNVRFIHCTLNGVNIDQTKSSQVEISRSRVINTSMSDGQLVAVFRNSILTKQTSLTDLQPPSSLTFEKSELIKVNMDRSKLKELVIVDSQFDGVFKSATAESVLFRNSVVDTSFTSSKIDRVLAENSEIRKMILNDARISKITLKACKRAEALSMYETHLGAVDISGCPLVDFSPVESSIESLSIKDGKLAKSDFENAKIKSFQLDGVVLDGKLDFTGTHAGKFVSRNVTKQPSLELITKGSNVNF